MQVVKEPPKFTQQQGNAREILKHNVGRQCDYNGRIVSDRQESRNCTGRAQLCGTWRGQVVSTKAVLEVISDQHRALHGTCRGEAVSA